MANVMLCVAGLIVSEMALVNEKEKLTAKWSKSSNEAIKKTMIAFCKSLLNLKGSPNLFVERIGNAINTAIIPCTQLSYKPQYSCLKK
ncbi:MAG: hypothetical protein RJA07_540 [Bacteroidota bacterium]